MKWSWKLGELKGISINVHATFLVLLGWVAVGQLEGGFQSAFWGLFFTVSVFATIVLHELGHALAAARYGIPTRDITLWPIGGVARLERMPREPKQELVVSLAGPAVNVALIVVLGIVNNFVSLFFAHYAISAVLGTFLSRLIWVNGFLALFNLLPAFPMDGGRVLRAFLAMRMSYVQATGIAASAGRMMSVLFGVGGLILEWPMLIVIAIFVWSAAGSERRMIELGERFGKSNEPFSFTQKNGSTVHNAYGTLRYKTSEEDDIEDGKFWEEGKKKKVSWSLIRNMFPDAVANEKQKSRTNPRSRTDQTIRVVFR